MNILGISAYYHDSAACLIKSGQVVAAAQEERFSRLKHDARFPKAAINYCLQAGGITHRDIDVVVYYEKPFRKFERLLSTYLTYAPRGLQQALYSLPAWIKEKVWIKEAIHRHFPECRTILFMEHHTAHAASAFFPSPHNRAAYLTVDGVGEFAAASYGRGNGNSLTPMKELDFPHSLGLLYSAFTAYCGFRVNSDEYKLMGLAPYGTPRYRQTILENLVDLKEDGSFRLNMEYFSFCTELTSTNGKFHELFGAPPQEMGAPLTELQMDIARSIQDVTEEIYLRLAHHVHRETGESALCLSGGVALNCVANGRLLREGPFKDIWIQPAAGDAGSALGAALWGWHHYLEQPRDPDTVDDSMSGSLLGPIFTEREIAASLDQAGAVYEKLDEPDLLWHSSKLLADGRVLGWFQGRMEYGPRALGNRSILADPRPAEMQSVVNRKIKFREDFRPFAPAIMESRTADYFELDRPSPYMLLVAPVDPRRRLPLDEQKTLTGLDQLAVQRSEIPAVTHIDNSARIQTVTEQSNPLFHRLLQRFEERTGCPLLLNTSFNVSEEPIVCSPKDAYRCFMSCDLDALVIGPYLLNKQDQPQFQTEELTYGETEASLLQSLCRLFQKRDETDRQLRNFGLLFGSMAAIGSLIAFLLTHVSALPLFIAGLILSAAALFSPAALVSLYRPWMAFGSLAGGLVTRILLTLFYLLALWSVALLGRLVGKKFLDIRPDRSCSTYWRTVSPPADEQLRGEKQY